MSIKNNLYSVIFIGVSLIIFLSLVSCDSSGSSSNSPDWVGNWEVVEFDSGEEPDSTLYYSITQEEFEAIENDVDGCNVNRGEITEVDENIVDVFFEDADEGEQDLELRLEVSGEILTVTILDGEDGTIGNEITAESVNSEPRDLIDCS